MTMRERMLAVVRLREHDRVPFVQYDGTGGPSEEIWSLIGRERMGVLRWCAVHRVEHPNCARESTDIERGGLSGTRTVMHTPEGSLTEERLRQPTYGAGVIRSHFVKEPADYKVLAAFLRDAVVLPDMEDLERILRELGEDGLPHVRVDRTPYQQLWVQWVSLEDLALHLVDCPDLVEECVSLMAANLKKQFEIAAKSPAPYVVFPDNITAPCIGERYFRKYCVPFYNELGGMMEEKGAPVYVHMDGDLGPLWGAIGESKVRGLDSFSPPPDNDTGAGAAAAMWPEMRLGVNFPSSVHLARPEAVYDRAMTILDEAGHTGRLQIQVSENVPPGVWRKSFPEIVRAIEDFGAPEG